MKSSTPTPTSDRNSLRFFTNSPVLCMAMGAVLISFSGVWVKVAQVTPTISAFYRVLFGGIFLFTAAVLKGELQWKGLKHLFKGIVCGLIFALDLICWHTSIQYVGPGLATILGNFQVFLITAAGVIVLNETLQLKFILSLPLAVVGLFLIVGIHWDEFGGGYTIGIFLGLLTAVCYTGFLLLLRHLQSDQKDESVFYVIMLVSFIAALFLGAEALRSDAAFVIPDLQTGLALTALGLFSQAIGWILITNALPRIQASLAGMLLLLQPALAFGWDVISFHRETDLVNWAGVAVVLAAIYMGTSAKTTSET